MADTTARDALERSLQHRMLMCSEDELRAIDRMVIAVEKRRALHVEPATPPTQREIAVALFRESSTERVR